MGGGPRKSGTDFAHTHHGDFHVLKFFLARTNRKFKKTFRATRSGLRNVQGIGWTNLSDAFTIRIENNENDPAKACEQSTRCG